MIQGCHLASHNNILTNTNIDLVIGSTIWNDTNMTLFSMTWHIIIQWHVVGSNILYIDSLVLWFVTIYTCQVVACLISEFWLAEWFLWLFNLCDINAWVSMHWLWPGGGLWSVSWAFINTHPYIIFHKTQATHT